MRNSSFPAKKVITLAIVIIFFLAVGVVIKTITSQPPAKPNTAHSAPPAIARLPIKNLADYPAIDAQFKTPLERQLYSQTKQSVSHIPDTYYGVVRAGSVTTSQSSQIVGTTADIKVTVQVTRFLIDIPAAQRTYRAEVYHDDSGQVAQSYVLCPTAAENNYGAFRCANQP